jgi:O-antigen ligase
MRFFALALPGLLLAWVAPGLFWQALATLVAAGLLFLAFAHTTVFCVAWLLVAGCSLEMTMTDLAGPEAFQPTIALIKAAEIGLAIVCALRWGVRADPWNPAWAFGIMAVAGISHGLYPGLTVADSLRSLIGSVAPFAFCFARTPRNWADAVMRAVRWCPIVAVAGGLLLATIGMRPLFIESGGLRLTGLGHPAFLASVCLAGVYAGLIQLYRTGRPSELPLLGLNLAILVLTGARAPLFYAAAVTGLTLCFVASPAVPVRWRLLLLLSAGVTATLLLILTIAGDLGSVRLFAVLGTDLSNLSGREYLWAAFEAVTGDSPWVGWGIGAGNVIIPPESPVAKLLHTWAAHNEYLRIEVEGGMLGRALLIAMFAVWVWQRSQELPEAERRILRLMFVAFAGHAFTDNVLISTPSCVLFALVAAVFSRTESCLPNAVAQA